MAHPPDARASADANSGTAIGIHAEAGREAEVQGNGSYAHTFRGAVHDARQLGLPRARRDRLVCGGPSA
eukprot:2037989-Alexandrium_andersonii.AAC.1